MSDVLESHLKEFFLGITDDLAQLLVDSEPLTIGAHMRNSYRRQIERRPIKFLTLAEGLLQSRAPLQNLLSINMAGSVGTFRNRGVKKRFMLTDIGQCGKQVFRN